MSDNNDQLDILKQWWNSYGKVALMAFILVVVVIIGWRTYDARQTKIAEAASATYDELVEVIKQTQSEEREKTANALIEKLNQENAGSVYADYANLIAARLGIEKKDSEAAKVALDKVIATTNLDIVKQVARYRYARILNLEKKYDEALEFIKKEDNGSMAGEFYALEGDIYKKQGKIIEARDSYKKALEIGAASRDPLIQIKAESLGEE